MNSTLFKSGNAGHKNRFQVLISLLLALVMALGMLPVSALATGHETQVRVIVENTTYLTSEGASWDGTLVDTWVTIDNSSTMMSCVVAALDTVSATQEGAESNYISSVNGLAASDGGSESGWMGTLNDWFTSEGFGAYTVAAGKLSAGDEIRMMYTTNGYGEDLGSSWGNTDNSVKAVAFSAGELSTDFSSSTYSYTLTLPEGTESLTVTPTATNKNYQVRTYLGTQAAGTEYKRSAAIPLEDGSVISVVCGDPAWPSMNTAPEAAKTYTFTVDTAVAVWSGDGTEESPYLLKTTADLKQLSDDSAENTFSGVYFKFADNITLPSGWTPVGTTSSRFSGNIDGDGYILTIPAGEKALIGSPLGATLKNLNIYGTQINGNGVVSIYATGATGTAITIENVTLKTGTQTLMSGFVGGYASGSYPVVIRNCTVEADVIIGYDGTKSNIGSFGGDFNGTIIGCVSHATVKGVSYVGGISGSKGQTMGDYIIADCIFDGEVIASGDNVGGVSGGGYAGASFGIASAPNTPCATIINCLVSGEISGVSNVGGILGAEPGVKECWNNGVGYIQNNLFTGALTATGENKGGIIGYMSCINNMNVISGNFYKQDCGATQGIGAAGMVETLETSGTFGTGWSQYTLSGKKWGRTDDPMGADAQALSGSCTEAELTDGTVLAELNSGLNSSKNWVAGTSFPTFTAYGDKHIYRIVCTELSAMSGVSQEANGVDVADGKELTLLYTDGTSAELSATDASVTKDYTVTTSMIGSYFPASLLYDGHQFVFNLGVNNTRPVRKAGVEATATDTATAGKAWTLDLSAIFTDPDGDALTYKVKIDTDSYVEAVTDDGVYSYTPGTAGSVTLKFKANDGKNDSTQSYTVTLTVEEAVSYTAALNAVLPYIRNTVTTPDVGSEGGEWAVFALNRGGASTPEWNTAYLTELKAYVDEQAGVLHDKKYTEYSRVVLALTSMGIDASKFKTDSNTCDLVSPLLDKQDSGAYWAEWQGNNGTCFALLALNCRNYLDNAEGNAARAALIKSLKDSQLASGAWGISDTSPDLDTTSAGVFALAPYYLDQTKLTALSGSVTYTELQTMVDSALEYLSAAQGESGGYGTVEADAWALIALASIGRDADTDTAFVKAGGSLLDDFLSYFDQTTGGFKHMSDGDVNQMATEQAAYGLVAYDRYKNNKNTLFDMTDTLSTDATVSEIKLGTLIAKAGANNSYSIEIPYSENAVLPATASEFTVTLTDSNARISTPLATENNGATWTFSVTAEDGVTTLDYTINISIANASITVKVGIYDYTAVSYGSEKASANGIVLSEREVTLDNTETALDAVRQALDAAGVSYTVNADYNYVSAVNGLGEYDCGSQSGWMFRVNNDFGNMGANATSLSAGDVLEWHYSVSGWGADVGSYWDAKPAVTRFTLAGTEAVIVTEGHEGTESDPYLISVQLPSGTSLTALSAQLETTLHPEYRNLSVDVTDAQDYSSGLKFKLYTDGDMISVWYSVSATVKGGGGGGGSELRVTFRLIGAEQATQDVNLSGSGYLPCYVTWIPTTSYILDEGATVYDLFVKAMSEAGLRSEGASRNYVETIYAPLSLGGYELSEFTNGQFSGWMYTIDGSHTGYGLKEQSLADGDAVVWHYVNDYRHEVADWASDPAHPSLGDGTYYSGWLEAEDVFGGKSSAIADPTDPPDPIVPDNPAEPVELPFTDVSGHWALDAIQFVFDNDLMNGVSGDLFDPDATLSRAMLITILYRLAGEPAIAAANPFTDVSSDEWYTNAIIWADENKLVDGYGNGLFGPADDITREQMAKILFAYTQLMKYDATKTNDLADYTDKDDVSAWALDAVMWANAEGLISGRAATAIVPGGNATRAEAATILMRYILNVVK